jgi:hypothetical protein
VKHGCQNREAGADLRRWPQPEPGYATPDSTGGLQPPAPPVTTALRVEHGSTTPHGVLLCARRTTASRNVTGMPTRRLTGTSVNTGVYARLAACHVWPSMFQKSTTTPTRRPEAP